MKNLLLFSHTFDVLRPVPHRNRAGRACGRLAGRIDNSAAVSSDSPSPQLTHSWSCASVCLTFDFVAQHREIAPRFVVCTFWRLSALKKSNENWTFEIKKKNFVRESYHCKAFLSLVLVSRLQVYLGVGTYSSFPLCVTRYIYILR